MKQIKESLVLRESIAEFIGTALLVFFGVGTVASLKITGVNFSQWEISIIWGIGVTIAIYATAGISGAHLNPAITLALAAFNGFDKRKVFPYIIAQVGGAIFAVAILYFIYSNMLSNYESVHHITRGTVSSLETASIFSTYATPMISVQAAFVVEFLITSILMFVVLAVTDNKNGTSNSTLAPLLIGLVVAIIGGSIGSLTGFAMNPARDFGPKLFTYLAGWDWIAFTGGRSVPYFIVPLFAPICGALFGAWLYKSVVTSHFNNDCYSRF